jgi:hypothetical protein
MKSIRDPNAILAAAIAIIVIPATIVHRDSTCSEIRAYEKPHVAQGHISLVHIPSLKDTLEGFMPH